MLYVSDKAKEKVLIKLPTFTFGKEIIPAKKIRTVEKICALKKIGIILWLISCLSIDYNIYLE